MRRNLRGGCVGGKLGVRALPLVEENKAIIRADADQNEQTCECNKKVSVSVGECGFVTVASTPVNVTSSAVDQEQ